MARAITPTELTYLRSGGQHSRLYLAVPETPAIFAAQINKTFTNAQRDMVVELPYDNVTTGGYGAIRPGETVLIGSTPGASDIGIVRARKAASSTVVYIGETSDLAFADNQYITVLRDFAPWPRHPRVTEQAVKMDWDIPYTDQNTDFSPIVIMGTDRVAALTGADVTLGWDCSESYIPESYLSDILWTCPGGTIDADDSMTPNITYDAPGTYQVYLAVTAGNGKTSTASRTVYVYRQFDLLDEEGEIIQAASPAPSCILNECGGALDAGGWSFGVTLLEGCDVTAIRPRAKVILFAEDYYNDAPLCMGPVTGSENIIAIGWIAEEGLEIAPDASAATFMVKGAFYWLNQESSFPLGIENTTGTADAWTNIHNLTPDKMLANTLTWRTTLPTIVDCFLAEDTRKASELTAQAGSIWQQMTTIAQATILARPLCDRYSRLYIEVGAQYLGSKAFVPVVMDITAIDRGAELSFQRRTVPVTGQLRLSGINFNGSSAKAIFSLSPGHTPKQYGAWKNQDYLLLASQTAANYLAGDIMGVENNPFPSIPVELAQNNRFIDICPRQFCYIDLPAADNVRGVGYTGNLVPKAVELVWDTEGGGFLATKVDFEAETVREINRKGDIPVDDGYIDPPIAPPEPPTPPDIDPPEPPIIEDPPPVSRINRVIVRENTQGIFYSDTISDEAPVWLVANYGLPVDPVNIDRIYPTGLKNLVVSYAYLQQDEEAYPASGLWGALPGNTFQKILSYADVAGEIGVTSATIRVWVAASPFDDTVAALCQSTNKFEGTAKLFIGTSAGGFTAGALIPHQLEVFYPFTTLGFGNGEWRIVTHQLFDDATTVVRISSDGSTITYDDSTTVPNLGDTNIQQPLSVTGPEFALVPCSSSIPQQTSDNGESFTAVPAVPTSAGFWYQALASDLTGTVRMWASDTPLSPDSGATWGSMAGLPGSPAGGARFFYYQPDLPDLNEWLGTVPNYGVTPPTGIYNSTDNGLTWTDRTGDLKIVAELDALNLVEIYGI